ncbi:MULTISPECIES: DsbA family protein [Rhizobium]|uniref:DsbA family protein n=1 Tax=Rhizobium rhododendri TaxID=2506430 RepID=A0ABY8IIC6_9HYPH|nr:MULTISPECIES: DsbA family protein [Rhizobium]MBZ5761107.1 DsbA family protein [Rhizobium sp. VS19-DR96]MBZ5767205.1 DsbA family protein [Rhizobium sp. VS19-DR129.2]MBZ5773506.1 DsbA family protein [Rhizobium sp. VS19-DRK62.2]MBZ5785517.1 DsbA family protein [Rhizobium sp. VS19-DR121]MBZ5802338.1 DsbA family protein [Rhizobium sp. VS19-DR181]
MPMSDMLLTKRHLLGGAALGAFAMALAATGAGTAFAATAPTPEGTVDMAQALQPGKSPDMAVGDPNAKVKIIEYMSTTCPHCAHFAATTFDPIKTKYIDTGKVYFIIREFPIASQDQDPAAYAAFMLVRCAPNGPSVPLLETFMKQQMQWAGPAVTDVRASLLQISKIAGFTQDSFEACLNNGALVDDINAVRARGVTFGVNGTPTFLINGKRYSGDMSVDSMSAIIDSML